MPFERYCTKKKANGISKSESDINTAEKKYWDSGYPPGVTVDELCLYRKKRPQGCFRKEDHLNVEKGSFKSIKSEYTRRYKNYYLLGGSHPNLLQAHGTSDLSSMKIRKPEDSLKFEGQHELKPLYSETFKQYPVERLVKRRPRNSFHEIMETRDGGDDSSRFSTEIKSKFIKYSDFEKSELIRRPTNLKIEGDLLTKTEQADKFIEYLLIKREHLIRKATTLKLEGDMEKKTETGEKYTPLDYQRRPPLCKKATNLHLEGDLNILTENLEKYVPLDYQQRPPLTKASTNLHLEGELDLHPEYRDAYIEYKSERQHPSLPAHNLKLNGFFDTETESRAKFDGYTAHPPIPFLRGPDSSKRIVLGDDRTAKYAEYKEKFIEHPKIERSLLRRPDHLQPKGDMQTVTENKLQFVEKRSPRAERRRMQGNLKLEGGIDMTPEYRKAYVNHYEDHSKSPIRRRGTLTRSTYLRNEGDMEINPEYRSSYVNFPRERPFIRKPESNLLNEGEMNHLTEKHAMYVQHSNCPKTGCFRREPELRLEGNLECQPEYRKAYIDYLIRERVDRKPRPLDNLTTQPTRAFEIVQPKQVQSSKLSTKPDDATKTENVEVVVEQPSRSGTSAQSTRASYIPLAIKKQSPTETVKTAIAQARPSSSLSSSASRRPRSISSSKLPKNTQAKPEHLVRSRLHVGGSSSKQSSRNVSPIPPSRRSKSDGQTRRGSRRSSSITNEKEETVHYSRIGSRFTSPVKVEDLAYRPCTSPLQFLLHSREYEQRKSRSDTKHDKKSKAFLVIDNEINNNFICDRKNNTQNNLYKEQRWMSSWYSPPT